ncbi:MAG TPA: YlxR family protein [Candidatus Nanopelagicaceae bacterium]|nr:YlxR family protein [Candidatus Nanopelagicaceae bacterium]
MPLRTCLGCRRRLPQTDLVRLRVSAGAVVIDPAGFRGPGRGAYICAKMDCWQAVVRRRALRHGLGPALAAADQTALAGTLAGMISNPPPGPGAPVNGLAQEER